MKVKVEVTQLCPTLWYPMDYTVHGILQARILEWVAFPFSRGSSQPRDRTQVSHIVGGFFTSWATRTGYSLQQKPCTWNSMPWTLRLMMMMVRGHLIYSPTVNRLHMKIHSYTTGKFTNCKAWCLLTLHSMQLADHHQVLHPHCAHVE